MPDNLSQLRNRINKAPNDPGVYRWLNAKGEVLYIGKAKNLKNRLRSYVQEKNDKSLGPWKLSLIKHIADFDVTVTKTELEALILETNLIKESKPKYNVLMKDDKNYVYVRISDEEYPCLDVVRRMEDDTAHYFGPYLSAYNIKRTLDTLHEIFHFRACKKSIEQMNKQTGEHPFSGADSKDATGCLDNQIGQCNGLCVGKISKEHYRDNIENVKRFLKGDHRQALHTIKEMMDNAAAEKKFERAAKLRDTLMYIESIGVQQVVSDTSRENTDAIGIALQGGKVQVAIMRERNGRLIEERTVEIGGEKDLISAVICEFIPQCYAVESDIPDLILIQEEIEDQHILEDWLKQTKGRKVEIRSPERGKKSKLLALAESNAAQKIQQQFAKWEAAAKNIDTALQELKEALSIESDLKRIEGYDISHLGGTETVGSMVVMKNGKPANKEYRSFTIRSMQSGEVDDYKALKEVLTRRLRYLSDEEGQLKEQGIIIGKARKNEQEIIETISAEQDQIGDDNIDYKDYTVARKDDVIIGFARLYSKEKDILQLRSLWVDQEYRGSHIGQIIVKAIQRSVKTGKLYITLHPDMEEYYAHLGFRYVQTPPSILAKKIKRLKKEQPDTPACIAMVFIAKDHKEDVSLKSIPDLLVIDGGKGQLSTAVNVLSDLQLTIPVIGIAKREEEIFVPGSSLPIDLPNDSQASFLLQRLRDEAHRFANSHREKRIAKGLIGSALDDVPGIGEKTKKELLNKFGSVDGVKNATDEKLLSIMSRKQLSELRSRL